MAGELWLSTGAPVRMFVCLCAQLFEVSKQLSQIKGERTSLSEEVDRLRQSEKQINQEKRYLEEQLEAARSGRGGENDPSTV